MCFSRWSAYLSLSLHQDCAGQQQQQLKAMQKNLERYVEDKLAERQLLGTGWIARLQLFWQGSTLSQTKHVCAGHVKAS